MLSNDVTTAHIFCQEVAQHIEANIHLDTVNNQEFHQNLRDNITLE